MLGVSIRKDEKKICTICGDGRGAFQPPTTIVRWCKIR
jgi:hypothetical protein